MSENDCDSCKRLETKLDESLKEIAILNDNIKALQTSVINSTELISIYKDIKSENEVLKEQNKKLIENLENYKKENPLNIQIDQCKEMTEKLNVLNDTSEAIKIVSNQFVESSEDEKRYADENKKLKRIINAKTSQINSMEELIKTKDDLIKEYNSRGGLERLKTLEKEVEGLERNLNGNWQETISPFDLLLESRIKLMLKRTMPAIAKNIGKAYGLNSKKDIEDGDSEKLEISLGNYNELNGELKEDLNNMEDHNYEKKEKDKKKCKVGKIKSKKKHKEDNVDKNKDSESDKEEINIESENSSGSKESIRIHYGTGLSKSLCKKKVKINNKRSERRQKISEQKEESNESEDDIIFDISKGLTIYEAKTNSERITELKKENWKKRKELNDWYLPDKKPEVIQPVIEDEKMEIQELGTKKSNQKRYKLTKFESEKIISEIMLVISIIL